MSISTKPILYNGYPLKGDLKVRARIDKVFFTEVYELTDGHYFYLFLNINPNEIIDRRGKYDLLRIKNT